MCKSLTKVWHKLGSTMKRKKVSSGTRTWSLKLKTWSQVDFVFFFWILNNCILKGIHIFNFILIKLSNWRGTKVVRELPLSALFPFPEFLYIRNFLFSSQIFYSVFVFYFFKISLFSSTSSRFTCRINCSHLHLHVFLFLIWFVVRGEPQKPKIFIYAVFKLKFINKTKFSLVLFLVSSMLLLYSKIIMINFEVKKWY